MRRIYKLRICFFGYLLAFSYFSWITTVTHILNFSPFHFFLPSASSVPLCFSSSSKFSFLHDFPILSFWFESQARLTTLCTMRTDVAIVTTDGTFLSKDTRNGTATECTVSFFLRCTSPVTYAKLTFDALDISVTPRLPPLLKDRNIEWVQRNRLVMSFQPGRESGFPLSEKLGYEIRLGLPRGEEADCSQVDTQTVARWSVPPVLTVKSSYLPTGTIGLIMCSWSVACTQLSKAPRWISTTWSCFPYPLGTKSIIPQAYIMVAMDWMLRRSCRPTLPVLPYYSNFVVNFRPDAHLLLHFAALELVTLPLVHFLFAAEHCVGAFLIYEQRMGRRWCRVLVPPAADVYHRMGHTGLRNFFLVMSSIQR